MRYPSNYVRWNPAHSLSSAPFPAPLLISSDVTIQDNRTRNTATFEKLAADLDFFGTVPFSSEEIREILSERHALTIIKESKNINIYLIDGIKVDIVNYRYLWIDECVSEEGLVLAGIKDIAAMKIAAIIGRGTKKDFIDLHFLLRTFSLRELLDLYMNKYPDGSVFIALKSLTYFEDAEADPMPTMFEDISWMTVKANIRTAVSDVSDFRHL